MRCWMHCPDTFSQRGGGLATPTLLYYAFLLDVCNHFYGKTTTPRFLGVFRIINGRGRRIRTPGTQFWVAVDICTLYKLLLSVPNAC